MSGQSPNSIATTWMLSSSCQSLRSMALSGKPPPGAAFPTYDWVQGMRWWPDALPNVWLGVSVEDRKYGLPRIDILRETPAAVRFLSIEPLLEDLGPLDLRGIHWVIAGGESGPGARPSHPDWFRGLRDQCRTAGVPFHFKQHGEWISTSQVQSVGHVPTPPDAFGVLTVAGEYIATATTWNGRNETDEGSNREAQMKRIGKRAAGRLLDGIEHNDYPKVNP